MYAKPIKILLSVFYNQTVSSLVEDINSLSVEEWHELLTLAQQHNVIPLVCDGLAKYRKEIPHKVFTKLVGLTLVHEDKYDMRVEVIKDLANLFNSHNIPFMVIKGYGISLYYPTPKHRSFSDIDTYNFGQIDRADEVLKKELGVDIDAEVHHHTTCVYRGVLVENHYDFVNTSSHKSNTRFEKILKAEVEKGCRTHKIGEVEILLPSPMFNALFLMRHMAMHYAAERVSLRHLCDWKQFVESESNNVDWAYVQTIYKQFNMNRFADAISAICIDHLGLNAELVPNIKRDEKLEERILKDILYAEFDEEKPKRGLFKIVWWKTRRFFANSWKHKLIYNESVLRTFIQSSYSHLLKPKTIKY